MNTPHLNPTSWLSQISSAIALIDKDFYLIDTSQNWLDKFELEKEKSVLLGHNLYDLLPNLSDDLKVKIEYILDGLDNVQIIDKHRKKDGQVVNYVWYLSPWKDGYGNLAGVILNVQDVTEAKEIEKELKRTKQHLLQKGKVANIGSWEYDLLNKEMYWSPVLRNIYGAPADYEPDLAGIIMNFKPGISQETIKGAVELAVKAGKPWEEDLTLVTTSGKEILVKTIGRPKFKDGRCSRILGTIQVLEDRIVDNAIEIKQSTSTSVYEKIFQLSNTPMVVNDFKTGRFIDANDSFLKLSQYKKEDIINESYLKFLNFKEFKENKPVFGLKRNSSYGPLEVEFANKKRRKLTLKLSGQLIVDEKNQQLVLSTIEDLTKTNELELNLKEKIGESKKEIEKLVNFAHMTSHNLKGHATNFSLLLNFLDKETDDKERQKILSLLLKGNEGLTDTIKGLREVVTIRQNINSKKKALVLNEYVFKAQQHFSGLIKKENVKIINEATDDIKVKSLPVYLESILSNIFSNAIKFKKPDKSPVIFVSVDKQKYFTIIKIEDNGIGIDMKKYGKQLFSPYRTGKDTENSRGMGLYLTKYQVELMKGKIEMESKQGEGTIVRVYFSNR